MLKVTQLHQFHEEHAEMTEFAGYEMPLWYSTTTKEHLAVRNASGIFDVSHMGRFSVEGPASTGFLEGLIPTSVQSQPVGKTFYSLLLDEKGGIIDDLIIQKLGEERYIAVVNAANTETDLRHMRSRVPPGLEIKDETPASAMIAVQGPTASESLQPHTDFDLTQLKKFRCTMARVSGEEALISRTGYTGEDGFEIIVFGTTVDRPEGALKVWNSLNRTCVSCGLGARDSLRLEAGLPLHGSDIDRNTNPYQADLAWVISAGKVGFVGAAALAEPGANEPSVIRRGLVLDAGIPRHGFEVEDDSGTIGRVTSGTYSPILRKGVALCQVDRKRSEIGAAVSVTVREATKPATITKPPFYDERLYGWKRQKGK